MTALPRALAPLRLHRYRLLAASMALSLLAAGLWAVAVVWQVVALGGGPAALSSVTALGAGGMLASTLLGGALADRVPQRRILLTTELVQGGTVAPGRRAVSVRRPGAVAPGRGGPRRWAGDGAVLPGVLGPGPRAGARG
jgi:MFS family permease